MRAVNNQAHAAVVWVPLVFVQQMTGISNDLTYWAALAMIVSRVLYFPLYAIGAVPFRSLSWMLFFVAAPVFTFALLTNLGAAAQ